MSRAVPIAIGAGMAIWSILFSLTLRTPAEMPAVQIRLIGECNGITMAAMEESAFPEGCTWIEPVRMEPGQ